MNTHRTSLPLALSGSILTVVPLAAPLILGIIMFFARGRFLFDWLMPGELFFAEAAAAAFLLIAALISRRRRAWIAWSAGVAVLALPATQLAANVLGLAHGDTEPGGWEMVVVLIIYGIYIAALIAMAVGGFRLFADLRRDAPGRGESPDGDGREA
jgi:hypothetical protein